MHPCLRVQRAKRFVKKKNLRLVSERARDRHTLLLTARELPGIFLTVLFQLHQLQEIVDYLFPFFQWPPANPQSKADILLDRHTRKQCVSLEDYTYAPFARRQIGYILAMQNHAARLRLFQA